MLSDRVKELEDALKSVMAERNDYQDRAERAEQAIEVITAGVKKLEANLEEVIKLKEKNP